MVPLRARGSRLWQASQRSRHFTLALATTVSLVFGGVLGQSTLATAQPAPPAADPAFFPATGYRISSPAVFDYFQHRGGVRTFGYPVSNEFPLLGQRVQLFQRAMLQLNADGSVAPANVLDPSILPITNIDGLNLPPVDPELATDAPTPDAPDYVTQALSFVSLVVPDDWNGLPVKFQTTFLNTVSCADAFPGADTCDPGQLAPIALEIWGLPTSLPASDPLNPDFVYQRFQRGIMHFSRATGLTQGLLIGDWLKRIMVGVDLSPDLNPEVRQSRFFAQYAPSRPLALDRPDALADTSLAQAFRNDTLVAAQAQQPTATLPPEVALTATAVALTATSVLATQQALQSSQVQLTATSVALTATAAVALATPTQTPGIISSVPVVNLGCLGDEQMWFVPRKPSIGEHVQISVTSQRHHDARVMVLSGPVDSGPVLEREGPLGFVWTWTIVPTVEAFYDWTFYADGLRPCITSGFNAFAPLGATPTPTITPQPTTIPTITPTPTSTPVAAPQAQSIDPTSGNCGDTISIRGVNFGSPQNGATVPPNGSVLFGSRVAQVLSWTNTFILIAGAPAGTPTGQSYAITVIDAGGASTAPQKFTLNNNPPGGATTC